jgi:molecular chaperone DnaK
MTGEKIIGIDLGTTNSVVAVMEGNEPKVIANQEGFRTTPSVVAFTDKGERLVGEPAKRQAVTNSQRTVFSIKRFMGRRHNEVQSEEKLVPYKVVGGGESLVKVKIDDKELTPPEISALVLRKLKEAAESYLGHKVNKAVITVPAYFNDAQRQATIDAAKVAGFDTEWTIEDPKTHKKSTQRMRIINEPTAASLAYGLDKKKDEKIAVFDLGGGTFDISILDVGEGVFEVKSTNGDTHLGGDDFDQVLIEHIASEFQSENGIDLRKDPMALQRLKEAAEQAKKDLSQQTQSDINLPFITANASGAKHLQKSLTRAKFEQLVEPLIQRCKGPVLQALKDAGYKIEDINEVVMVGGMTRMPRVQALVKEIFGKDGHRGVNPDEVVAVGAAIQGAQILLGSLSSIVLVDVTPLSLGLETMGGVFTKLIEKNTTIPTTKKEVFTTADDNQRAVTVKVFQGERPMANDNRLLSQFDLTEIEMAQRHVPKIEVSFDIDKNGILNVSARDQKTGKEVQRRIEQSSGMSKEEIEKMVKEAASFADDDKKKKDLADARNEADSAIYNVEKTMNEANMSQDNRKPFEDAIQKVRSANDAAAIRQAVNDLHTAAHAAARHAQDVQAAQAAKPAGDEVIDAEFEEKKAE